MGDVIYYLSIVIVIIGIPALIAATIVFLAKPHIVNNKLKSPLSRKRILAMGIVSIVITLFGFGTVMAATEPASVRASIAASALASQKSQDAIKAQQEQTAKQATIDAAKPVTKTVTEAQPIQFQSTTQNDSTLPSGQTKVSVTGVNGVNTVTYLETFVNGTQTNKVQTSSQITTKPVTQVTLVGTYVAPTSTAANLTDCQNGTYVNSAGNAVCSPYATSSTPSGATAQCVDGTYSFSQSRSGTCSHHGGVATWL
jgi:hypothetical protein